jgi:SAM-dependent methyltransferase
MNPGGGFGPVVITQADARQLPLPDESVDLIVTSPPFLNLRSYQDGGAHMEHQIGAGTREEFLAQLWEVTAEMRRVLKPAGSLFVELGDSYTDKCLNMTPHRYAIGCVDRLGLIRYYAAVDEIRESSTDSNSSRKRARDEWDGTGALREAKPYGGRPTEVAHRGVPGVGTQFMGNPLGKLPGSVWGIPTAPLTVPKWLGVDHFAAMAPEVARRVVLGWSPREVCTGCGEGRRPVTEGTPIPGWIRRTPGSRQMSTPGGARGEQVGQVVSRGSVVTITGSACGCSVPDAPTVPGVILDPFGGAGTSALVASCFGRVGISNDLSADYGRLARWRTTDPGERARVLDVAKPERPVAGQLGLFDGLER